MSSVASRSSSTCATNQLQCGIRRHVPDQLTRGECERRIHRFSVRFCQPSHTLHIQGPSSSFSDAAAVLPLPADQRVCCTPDGLIHLTRAVGKGLKGSQTCRAQRGAADCVMLHLSSSEKQRTQILLHLQTCTRARRSSKAPLLKASPSSRVASSTSSRICLRRLPSFLRTSFLGRAERGGRAVPSVNGGDGGQGVGDGRRRQQRQASGGPSPSSPADRSFTA